MNIQQYLPLSDAERTALGQKARAAVAEMRYTSEVLPAGAMRLFCKAATPAVLLSLLAEIDHYRQKRIRAVAQPQRVALRPGRWDESTEPNPQAGQGREDFKAWWGGTGPATDAMRDYVRSIAP